MRWLLFLCLAACQGGAVSPRDTDDTDSDPVPVDFDEDGSFSDEDCDDQDFEVHPGADESCDGKDNDCDGVIDEEDAVDADTWYSDADRDGFGANGSGYTSCEQPPDTADRSGDCDDSRDDVHPDAEELCDVDDVDEDCDGLADDLDDSTLLTSKTLWHVDNDGDGFGNPDNTVYACDAGEGRVADATDCDDRDARANPRDGCAATWDGAWEVRGTLVIYIPDLGVKDSCSFTLGVEIDASGEPDLTTSRTAVCALAAAGIKGVVKLQADLASEDVATRTLELDADRVPVEVRFTAGPDRLQASGSDTLVVGGLKVAVDHTLDGRRVP